MPDFINDSQESPKPENDTDQPINIEPAVNIEKESGFSDLEPEPEAEPEEYHEISNGKVIEEVVEQMDVKLPKVSLPLPMKLIALITFVGGLGILGSSLTGVFSPNGNTFKGYILNLIAGIVFVGVAYGLYRQQNWSTWLYGVTVVIGLFINPAYSVVPAIIVIYLIMNRRYLYASIFDRTFRRLSETIGSGLKMR